MTQIDSMTGAAGGGEFEPQALPHEAIGAEGFAQINAVLGAAVGLDGDELVKSLEGQFAVLKEQGQLVGGEAISAWAESESRQQEVALVIEGLPGARDLPEAERERLAIAETLYLANLLGSPWHRSYENHGQPIQHVKPDKAHWGQEVSDGTASLWPHNEILPSHDRKIVCSEFSTLIAVHNESSEYPSSATTLYDAQKAISQLDPDTAHKLQQPDFIYVGTILEKDAGDTKHEAIPVIVPIVNEQGELVAYDLIADLDDVTMVATDEEGWQALHDFRAQLMKNEVEYTIPNGAGLVWRNRKALHGRREVFDPERHLVRSQVGEAELASAS